MKQLKHDQELFTETQGQNVALPLLHVTYLLDSGLPHALNLKPCGLPQGLSRFASNSGSQTLNSKSRTLNSESETLKRVASSCESPKRVASNSESQTQVSNTGR